MLITDMNNLWVGYNKTEHFRILICASDEIEASEIAKSYCEDNNMQGTFEIAELKGVNTQFDCDYVVL